MCNPDLRDFLDAPVVITLTQGGKTAQVQGWLERLSIPGENFVINLEPCFSPKKLNVKNKLDGALSR